MMATTVATGLEIEGEDHIRPVSWDEWITLPIREQDNAVHTVRGPIRVPTVIVAVNFAKVPKRRPKLCSRTTPYQSVPLCASGPCQYYFEECRLNRATYTRDRVKRKLT